MFRASSAHLQEDIVVYKQHVVPSLSIRVPGGHQDSYREWRYHMLLVYNYVLLKMSTWCSKHVEESNILRINNSQCINIGNTLLGQTVFDCMFIEIKECVVITYCTLVYMYLGVEYRTRQRRLVPLIMKCARLSELFISNSALRCLTFWPLISMQVTIKQCYSFRDLRT